MTELIDKMKDYGWVPIQKNNFDFYHEYEEIDFECFDSVLCNHASDFIMASPINEVGKP
jgi:hypothetical protein